MSTSPMLKKQMLIGASILLGATANCAVAQEYTLPNIMVEEQALPNSSSEDRYFSEVSDSATKSSSDLATTPQSVSVITKKQMDDQNVQSVRQALNYSSGVLSTTDNTSRYDSVFLRGFGGFGTTTRIADFLDGMKLPRGQAFGLPSIDASLLDHVDVLKGPSATLYGQSGPGGLINQVSRKPSSEASHEVRLEMGSHDRVQAGFTSQGALNEADTWQYSVSGIARKSDTEYDDVEEERQAVSPTIRWQPDENTELVLRGFYQQDPESGYFNSTYPSDRAPAAYRSALKGDLNVGDPGFDMYDREQYALGYEFQHRFNRKIKIRSAARYFNLDLDFRGLQMAAAITKDGLLPRQAAHSIEDADNITTDNAVEFFFDTGAVQHTFTLGLGHQKSTSNWQYLFGAAPDLDVLSPVYNIKTPALTTIIDNEQTLEQTGVYLQEQFTTEQLTVLLGVRRDWTKQNTKNRLASTKSSQSDSATSYRSGLSYQFTNGITPFVSYATSFEPTIGVDEHGAPFVPTEANQWEIGVKYQPFDTDILLTLSAFDIHQENVLTPSPTPGFNVQLGEIRSRGAELEVRGRATENLELIGALTQLDAEVSETTVAANQGNRPQAVPELYGSLWANYHLSQGHLKGLTIGAGARYVGSSYADDANTIKSDGYSVLDAALRYDLATLSPDLEGAEITLNMTNLSDKDYYASCTYNFYCQRGQGRTFLLGARYQW